MESSRFSAAYLRCFYSWSAKASQVPRMTEAANSGSIRLEPQFQKVEKASWTSSLGTDSLDILDPSVARLFRQEYGSSAMISRRTTMI